MLTQDPALAAPIVLTPTAPPRRQAVPEQLTSFVGRTRELADLAATVRRERLTTIVGPAGVGKTRLALELVRQLAEEGEVWYIELAPLTEESTVAEAIASTVELWSGLRRADARHQQPSSEPSPGSATVKPSSCSTIASTWPARRLPVSGRSWPVVATCAAWRPAGSRWASTARGSSPWDRSTTVTP